MKIGPKMIEAARYVEKWPGHTKYNVAEGISPDCIPNGYRIVNRAIDAGMIIAKPGDKKGSFKLYPRIGQYDRPHP